MSQDKPNLNSRNSSRPLIEKVFRADTLLPLAAAQILLASSQFSALTGGTPLSFIWVKNPNTRFFLRQWLNADGFFEVEPPLASLLGSATYQTLSFRGGVNAKA